MGVLEGLNWHMYLFDVFAYQELYHVICIGDLGKIP